MSRLIKFLGIPVVAIALLALADTPDARAQGFSLRIGGHGISHGHHNHHFTPHYRTVRPVSNYRSYWRRPAYFHDTTHLDYHGPQLVPHNGHLDYVPGHYDVHRTGHWHH